MDPVTSRKLYNIQRYRRYMFKDHKLLEIAFYSAGPTINGNIDLPYGNEILAMLGTQVHQSILEEICMEIGFTSAHAYYTIDLWSADSSLAIFARGLGWDHSDYQTLPPYCNEPTDKMLADIVRAVLGAVYLDSRSDIELVRRIWLDLAELWHGIWAAKRAAERERRVQELMVMLLEADESESEDEDEDEDEVEQDEEEEEDEEDEEGH